MCGGSEQQRYFVCFALFLSFLCFFSLLFCVFASRNAHHSVLDDNKLLTLPSGERLGIPDNMRIILEVDSLNQATPATVSRCGMIWFSNDTLSDVMRLAALF